MGSNMFASGLVLKTESIENEGGTQGKLESSYRELTEKLNLAKGITKDSILICQDIFLHDDHLETETRNKWFDNVVEPLVNIIELFSSSIYNFEQFLQIEGIMKYQVSESIIAEIKVNASSNMDNEYSCPNCQKKFTTLKDLDNHKLKYHNIKSLYPCNICGDVFIYSELDLTNHKKLKHPIVKKKKETPRFTPKDGPRSSKEVNPEKENHASEVGGKVMFKCSNCEEGFTTALGLIQHNISEHKKSTKVDDNVEKSTKVDNDAEESMVDNDISHQGDDIHVDHEEVILQESTESKDDDQQNAPVKDLEAGISSEVKNKPQKRKRSKKVIVKKKRVSNQLPNNKEILTCEICGKNLFRKNFRKHMDLHDSGKLNSITYTCDICSAVLFPKRVYLKHMRDHNSKEPAECEICGKKYSYNNHKSYRLHMKRHKEMENQPPVIHKCNICQKVFKKERYLKGHMDLHNNPEKNILCNECGKAFRTEIDLKYHKKWHNDEKPFPCDICGYKFKMKSSMVSHRRVHTGEKPHSCTVCSKTFRTSDSKLVHMRIHTGERPYKCDICDKRFICSSKLSKHKRTAHGIISLGKKVQVILMPKIEEETELATTQLMTITRGDSS